jgi:malonyl-CoA decarboxylase
MSQSAENRLDLQVHSAMDTPQPRHSLRSAAGRGVRASFESMLGNRIGKLVDRIKGGGKPVSSDSLLDYAAALLSMRGRASGAALASAFFDRYEASDIATRHLFLAQLHAQNPRSPQAIDAAVAAWARDRDDKAAALLNEASESPCARLIRVLNLAPGGTRRLIAMRHDLLSAPEMSAGLRDLDREFSDAFTAWFNAGFLELRHIDWNSPAALLERIIRYEAVHSIAGWDDLRRRVEPADRRCYGFFHPQMADDPLIFVEVALTNTVPSAIAQIISPDRAAVDPRQARCAIFYSISNCQQGLRGIPFGNFLIKQVVGLLKDELPALQLFATLSPVPGFAKWLAKEYGDADVPTGDALRQLAAQFITTARDRRGQVQDPVGRFHLGNGARLEAIHAQGDLSAKGMREAHGVMVNYLYDLSAIEANHVRLFELGEVTVSPGVQELMKPAQGQRKASGRKALASAE